MNDTLTVKYYRSPKGFVKELEIKNVYPEDIEFFESNDVVVSMEEIAGEQVVWCCPATDDSEESEVVLFAGSKNCQDTMKELRKLYEEKFL